MFFIGQNLKHVHMTYSFLELLILFCLEFISHHTKEIFYANTNFTGNQSWNTNHEFVSNIDVEKICFFNVKLKLGFFFFSFSICFFFFHKHSRFTGQQGKREDIYLTPLYHLYQLHRHLDISRAVTAESSPQHIASSRTRTQNLRFSSTSH